MGDKNNFPAPKPYYLPDNFLLYNVKYEQAARLQDVLRTDTFRMTLVFTSFDIGDSQWNTVVGARRTLGWIVSECHQQVCALYHLAYKCESAMLTIDIPDFNYCYRTRNIHNATDVMSMIYDTFTSKPGNVAGHPIQICLDFTGCLPGWRWLVSSQL